MFGMAMVAIAVVVISGFDFAPRKSTNTCATAIVLPTSCGAEVHGTGTLLTPREAQSSSV